MGRLRVNRLLTVAVASLVAVSLSACGSKGTDGSAAAPAPSTSPKGVSSPTDAGDPSVPTMSTDDLKAQLLTVSDLPTGWAVDNSDDDDDDDAPECMKTMKGLDDKDAPNADADFAKQASLPTFSEGLAFYLDANASFEAAQLALNQCTSFDFDIDGSKAHATMGQMSFPAVGDKSAAWALSVEIEGYTASGVIVAGTIGNVLFDFAYVDLGPSDTGEVQRLVKRGVAKIHPTNA